ncbi:TetR family transcriptional regulator [Prauserella marina]|uniref:Regulatory protein, tetR family n=1 Tax=Prauserella marina TaxID=530584 RepID=A0A222VNR0_9PSEU|nr:TetR/AcrR family transcriptional regulator [Prauserella marina]ASR35548.1 TetR family transcriptional regulator [Prauserella marina]PWV84610.1 TetR family transcriptional regulator [Prauserella marina]SDC17781.1 regulatory protein, tetR family [Prauserella marina]
MARARSTETKDRIQAAALDLFAEKGVQQTSLREIAERLGLTKPALYYHFASREDLVNSLVQPLIEDIEALLVDDEAAARTDRRALLDRYFDVTCRHRRVTALLVREVAILARLDLGTRIAAWRLRLMRLLAGPGASLAEQAKAVSALGGLADCIVLFADVPVETLRPAALGAAYATLGIEPGESPQ